jgi:hypothetical protein
MLRSFMFIFTVHVCHGHDILVRPKQRKRDKRFGTRNVRGHIGLGQLWQQPGNKLDII